MKGTITSFQEKSLEERRSKLRRGGIQELRGE
jgi:hypothetical protein